MLGRRAGEVAEGAITITFDGLVLFSNRHFADTLGTPLERVIGSYVYDYGNPENQASARPLNDEAWGGNVKGEIRLLKADGSVVPTYVSINRLEAESFEGFAS